MKTILCYGDSNTWGAMPLRHLGDIRRFPPGQRWPGVLRQSLGEAFWVIEEGLNGRTSAHDDPFEGAFRNGLTYLTPCLESHRPLDLVIVMLGTNDLKSRFSMSAPDIASGAGALLDTVSGRPVGPDERPPATLLICPPPLTRLDLLADMFAGGAAKSHELARHYEAVARLRGSHFMRAGDHIASSERDGIHFDADQHIALGQAVSARVREILTAG